MQPRGESMRKCILVIAILLIIPTVVFAAKDGCITALTVLSWQTAAAPKYNFNGKTLLKLDCVYM